MTIEIISAEALKRAYGDGEYPAYTRAQHVESGSTLDYWEWVYESLTDEAN